MTMTELVPAVLLVEDDATLRDEVSAVLRRDGMVVRSVWDGAGALALAGDGWRPDVVVVDLLLPTLESYVVSRALRSAFGVPIVVTGSSLSRFGGTVDEVIPRPIDLSQLAARIRAVLRRDDAPVALIRVGDLLVMPREGRAFLGERELSVTADEVSLLARLAEAADRPVRKSELRGALRGVTADTDSRIVDVHLIRLMVKLEGSISVCLRRTATNDAYVLTVTPALALAVPA